MRIGIVVYVAALTLLASCASTPQGSTSYYFPKAETQLVITQTLSCNAKGDRLREVVTVTPTTIYTADLSLSRGVFEPRRIDGALADASVSLTFTDDGRLAGINTTSTGQGATIIKDIIGVAKAAGIAVAAADIDRYNAKQACVKIKDYASKATPTKNPVAAGADVKKRKAAGADGDKQQAQAEDAKKTEDGGGAADAAATVTLTYARTFQYGKLAAGGLSLGIRDPSLKDPPAPALEIKPDAGSISVYNELIHQIPNLAFALSIVSPATKMEAAQWSGASKSDYSLKLNSVALSTLSLDGPVGDLEHRGEVWKGQLAIPLSAEEDRYDLPIPKAKLFGTQKFALTLSNYGSITKLEYSKTISDALTAADSVGTAVATAMKPPTAAQQAAALQSQADLIYQQQRLASCEAEPGKCAAK